MNDARMENVLGAIGILLGVAMVFYGFAGILFG